ncbi:MAG TPA: ribonuclease HI family protein [Tepidisphaeraceae bacterium]|jgi:ribonuclease HI|nr:ribonuclease HI family protein [Tepidisphaeraceae bacterium]
MDGPIVINFDGGSRGNPGIAGVGIVLSAPDGTPLITLGRYIGTATNNVAEYKAVILGLEKALELHVTQVIVRGDSELIIKQLSGAYRVKQPHLLSLWERAKSLLAKFKSVKLEHNLRHKNALADKLANVAMDRKSDVTDADLPASTGSSSPGPGVSSDASSPRPPEIGDAFSCRRCGTIVELVKPASVSPAELRDFVCQCGARMHRRP